MRQLKNCKVGHFVIYNDNLYQVNCFYTTFKGKMVTLTPVKDKSEKGYLEILPIETKVEYKGDHAKDKYGRFWVYKK